MLGLSLLMTLIRKHKLELALAASLLSLAGQLLWPSLRAWLNRPRPGFQTKVDWELGSALVYLPSDYHSTSEPWPLIIFLHGSGNRGYDVDGLRTRGPASEIENGRQLPFIVATPQCPPGKHWSTVRVAYFLDEIEKDFNCGSVFLTGASMGGSGTWRAASAMPDRFDAIAPLCGSGDPSDAKQLIGVPTWAFHGANDTVIPVDESEKMVQAINATGGKAKLTVYPNAGHGIEQLTYGDEAIYHWFLQLRKTNDIHHSD